MVLKEKRSAKSVQMNDKFSMSMPVLDSDNIHTADDDDNHNIIKNNVKESNELEKKEENIAAGMTPAVLEAVAPGNIKKQRSTPFVSPLRPSSKQAADRKRFGNLLGMSSVSGNSGKVTTSATGTQALTTPLNENHKEAVHFSPQSSKTGDQMIVSNRDGQNSADSVTQEKNHSASSIPYLDSMEPFSPTPQRHPAAANSLSAATVHSSSSQGFELPISPSPQSTSSKKLAKLQVGSTKSLEASTKSFKKKKVKPSADASSFDEKITGETSLPAAPLIREGSLSPKNGTLKSSGSSKIVALSSVSRHEQSQDNLEDVEDTILARSPIESLIEGVNNQVDVMTIKGREAAESVRGQISKTEGGMAASTERLKPPNTNLQQLLSSSSMAPQIHNSFSSQKVDKSDPTLPSLASIPMQKEKFVPIPSQPPLVRAASSDCFPEPYKVDELSQRSRRSLLPAYDRLSPKAYSSSKKSKSKKDRSVSPSKPNRSGSPSLSPQAVTLPVNFDRSSPIAHEQQVLPLIPMPPSLPHSAVDLPRDGELQKSSDKIMRQDTAVGDPNTLSPAVKTKVENISHSVLQPKSENSPASLRKRGVSDSHALSMVSSSVSMDIHSMSEKGVLSSTKSSKTLISINTRHWLHDTGPPLPAPSLNRSASVDGSVCYGADPSFRTSPESASNRARVSSRRGATNMSIISVSGSTRSVHGASSAPMQEKRLAHDLWAAEDDDDDDLPMPIYNRTVSADSVRIYNAATLRPGNLQTRNLGSTPAFPKSLAVSKDNSVKSIPLPSPREDDSNDLLLNDAISAPVLITTATFDVSLRKGTVRQTPTSDNSPSPQNSVSSKRRSRKSRKSPISRDCSDKPVSDLSPRLDGSNLCFDVAVDAPVLSRENNGSSMLRQSGSARVEESCDSTKPGSDSKQRESGQRKIWRSNSTGSSFFGEIPRTPPAQREPRQRLSRSNSLSFAMRQAKARLVITSASVAQKETDVTPSPSPDYSLEYEDASPVLRDASALSGENTTRRGRARRMATLHKDDKISHLSPTPPVSRSSRRANDGHATSSSREPSADSRYSLTPPGSTHTYRRNEERRAGTSKNGAAQSWMSGTSMDDLFNSEAISNARRSPVPSLASTDPQVLSKRGSEYAPMSVVQMNELLVKSAPKMLDVNVEPLTCTQGLVQQIKIHQGSLPLRIAIKQQARAQSDADVVVVFCIQQRTGCGNCRLHAHQLTKRLMKDPKIALFGLIAKCDDSDVLEFYHDYFSQYPLYLDDKWSIGSTIGSKSKMTLSSLTKSLTKSLTLKDSTKCGIDGPRTNTKHLSLAQGGILIFDKQPRLRFFYEEEYGEEIDVEVLQAAIRRIRGIPSKSDDDEFATA